MVGPGLYIPDVTEGITDPSELPPALIRYRDRCRKKADCPKCGRSCGRNSFGNRTLHDLGAMDKGCPINLKVAYSKHRCFGCNSYFNTDLGDLAPRGSQYTNRVVETAVRLILEDGLPYRVASWHMWRDHRVFVPFATIQNWSEAAAQKKS